MQFLRFMALLEGTSFLVLLAIAMPLKYWFGVPEAVKMIGLIHGLLFVTFNALLFGYTAKGYLSWGKAFVGFVASLIPFGTFVFEAKVLKVQPLKS